MSKRLPEHKNPSDTQYFDSLDDYVLELIGQKLVEDYDLKTLVYLNQTCQRFHQICHDLFKSIWIDFSDLYEILFDDPEADFLLKLSESAKQLLNRLSSYLLSRIIPHLKQHQCTLDMIHHLTPWNNSSRSPVEPWESDFDFLSDLLEEYGFTYHVENETDKKCLGIIYLVYAETYVFFVDAFDAGSGEKHLLTAQDLIMASQSKPELNHLLKQLENM